MELKTQENKEKEQRIVLFTLNDSLNKAKPINRLQIFSLMNSNGVRGSYF